jgi:2-oxo-3-hexenedioate decarboxylase
MSALREAAGRRRVGRKVGFSNRALWDRFGVSAPIWGELWDDSCALLPEAIGAFDLAGLAEPLIEPEIVLGLARAPEPGMGPAALAGCLEWVAPGFEIVQSPYPGWRFTAADAVAGWALHGALLVGPRVAVSGDEAGWAQRLAAFTMTLAGPDGRLHPGAGANVLGSPLAVAGMLAEGLAAAPGALPLAAGEMVTTGSLTDAMPVAPGETWTVRFAGIPLPAVSLRLA